MNDNEFLQNDQRPRDAVAGTHDAYGENEAVAGKKAGLFDRFLGNKKTGANKDAKVVADADSEFMEDGDKPAKKEMNKPLLIGGGVVLLGVVLGILMAIAMGGGDEPAPQPQPEVTQGEQMVDQEPPEMSAVEVGPNNDIRDYYVAHTVRAGLPPDHWAKASDPIGTLTTTSIERAMVKIPEWNSAVSGVNIASGVTYANNSFEFSQLKSQATGALAQAINNDVQIHSDPQGQPVILERASPESIAAGGPEFDVIKTATAYDTIATNAELLAQRIWSETIAQARMMLPPPAPEVQPAQPVDTGISTAQRNEYNRLLSEADAWQKELVRENKRMKEELVQQQRQVIEVLQKVEDNPVANNNMRARMITTATDMKVQAIQGDLVFLEDKDGRVHSYRVGDPLPSTDLVISNVDANTGLVYVTKK